MSRILVTCPSRGRPGDLFVLHQSILETSTSADLVAYIDADEEDVYRATFGIYDPPVDRFDRSFARSGRPTDHQIRFLVGNRVGPVGSVNRIAAHYREGYASIGVIPDDAAIVTREWDRFVIERTGKFRNGIGLISPHHNMGGYVNFPFISRAWFETLGWFAYPTAYHFIWDTVLELLGEAAGAIYHATAEEFDISNRAYPTINTADHYRSDAESFLLWAVTERSALVKKIREAIAR